MDKLFEKTKIRAFLNKDAAILGTILSKLNFRWDSSISTACAGARELRWNPDWFKSLPGDTRVSILLHELWHVARLHMVRLGNRNPKIWNMACDIRINNDLWKDGYRFEGTDGLWDDTIDQPSRLSEEEIYDLLVKSRTEPENQSGGDLDYSAEGSEEEVSVIQIVQSANDYAKSFGAESTSQVEEILAKKLKPKVPWRRLLRQFFMDITKEDYSWKRPNRRYEDIYLPSMTNGERLISLNYYIDTSGSISTEQLIRFNAELRSICEDLKPKLLRVINFDYKIQDIQEITSDQPYKYFKFTGRGGTSLKPVMDHITETKPVAAIIFSDLLCPVPREFPKVPIIWICINNLKTTMPVGKMVHISTEELTDGRKQGRT